MKTLLSKEFPQEDVEAREPVGCLIGASKYDGDDVVIDDNERLHIMYDTQCGLCRSHRVGLQRKRRMDEREGIEQWGRRIRRRPVGEKSSEKQNFGMLLDFSTIGAGQASDIYRLVDRRAFVKWGGCTCVDTQALPMEKRNKKKLSRGLNLLGTEGLVFFKDNEEKAKYCEAG